MRKMVSVRLDTELLHWADQYASQMSTPEKVITRTAVIEGGLKRLRELASGSSQDLEPELPDTGSEATVAAAALLRGRRL